MAIDWTQNRKKTEMKRKQNMLFSMGKIDGRGKNCDQKAICMLIWTFFKLNKQEKMEGGELEIHIEKLTGSVNQNNYKQGNTDKWEVKEGTDWIGMLFFTTLETCIQQCDCYNWGR